MSKNTLSNLSWRYATKVFDPSKKLTAEQAKIISESIRLAPTSFGLQPFKVLIVDNPELRAKLKEVSYGQSQITDASKLFIFCLPLEVKDEIVENHVKNTAVTRGTDIKSLDGFRQMLLGFMNGKSQEELLSWSARQAYIALGFAMLAAAENEIDTCPMEGFDNSKYDEILGLHDLGLKSLAVLAVGFRSSEDKYSQAAKVRLSEKDLFLIKN